MTDAANLIRHLPGANLSPLQVIHERNQQEVVEVVNQINALNEKLKAAKKEQRPDLLRKIWRLLGTYQYLKWAIESFAEGKS